VIDDFQRLLGVLRDLSRAELLQLDASVRGLLAAPPPAVPTEPTSDLPGPGPQPSTVLPPEGIAAIEAAFAREPECPACQSKRVGKWGSANRLRRYRCKVCKVSFNCLTGTPLAQLHKRELWSGHAQALVDGISLRKAATRLGVHVSTTFRWRHRFLRATKTVKAQKVQGTVEADETFFRRSFKGARKLIRKPHKRGGDNAKPGLSDDQVPVLIAQDRTAAAATTDAILPDRSAASIEAHLGAIIDRRAVLVTDADPAFSAFANKLEIAHVSLNASKKERRWDGYHIQHVNAYCNDLKGWMFRFRGVATKYLDSYLSWHRMNDRDSNTQTARSVLIAAWG
jgi:transposase-like protein